MESPRLGERARSKLIHLLSDDHPDPAIWVGRLRTFRDFESAPAFATAVQVLFHLDLDDGTAERLLETMLAHRDGLTRALGRDPGLRVAAMDYLSNVEKRYDNPKIVEMQEFEETERSAHTDPLTGVANRRLFDEALDREVRRSRRYRWPLTVLMLDLDHFKAINDAFGHLIGDLVLERVGGILRHAVREADVACRYGGEEFAVILPETSRVGGFAVAERIRRRLVHAFEEREIGGHAVAMSVSIGLATYPEDGLHPVEILARADEALYGAKRAGRNTVCVHHRERRAAVRFPLKASTVVFLEGIEADAVHAVDLSRTGILLETGAPLQISEAVAMRVERSGHAGAGEAWTVCGRVVRVDSGPGSRGVPRVGVAFDAPLPEERVMQRACLSRLPARAARGGGR